jgi:hypothetical protein
MTSHDDPSSLGFPYATRHEEGQQKPLLILDGAYGEMGMGLGNLLLRNKGNACGCGGRMLGERAVAGGGSHGRERDDRDVR